MKIPRPSWPAPRSTRHSVGCVVCPPCVPRSARMVLITAPRPRAQASRADCGVTRATRAEERSREVVCGIQNLDDKRIREHRVPPRACQTSPCTVWSDRTRHAYSLADLSAHFFFVPAGDPLPMSLVDPLLAVAALSTSFACVQSNAGQDGHMGKTDKRPSGARPDVRQNVVPTGRAVPRRRMRSEKKALSFPTWAALPSRW